MSLWLELLLKKRSTYIDPELANAELGVNLDLCPLHRFIQGFANQKL